MAKKIEDMRALLKDVRGDLMAKPNVIATGIGYKYVSGKKTDEIGIICSVEKKVAKTYLSESETLPEKIQDVSVDVFVSGLIHAFQDPTGRFRPAPGGVSIGHVNITAGTLGCLVKKDDQWYILSNNHVLANSNDAAMGDAIVQPGPYDGGSDSQDRIATLADFVPIQFEGGTVPTPCPVGNMVAGVLNGIAAVLGSRTRLLPVRPQASSNLVDAAIAKPLENDLVIDDILNIGKISGVADATLGMSITKSGRTTGVTTGTINQIDVTSQVSYGNNKIATFVDQLLAGSMSAGGDSGSAVLSSDKKLVGLLFAGSNTTTLINRIQNVFDALQVSR
jgi:hypothetical protein